MWMPAPCGPWTLGDMEELKKKHTGTARVKGLPDASITNLSILIKANNEAKL